MLIDLANRRINLLVDDTEPAARHAAQDAQRGKPVEVRPRKVTTALKRYAVLATSADKGVVHATLSSRV
ncbi:dihydroxy-acid dehydratase [Xanthomonas translucens pv. graminis]|nr:dihydroxy-acid dehydratase [Xanthomonas translucens pv. graminis]WIH10753.1 dihydroxy-acid dehydratase [Xanthomonas translucens pv. graminis]WIH14387.1 dihydroxy-acid dehydratase [Xanthomonas translucens pv. graminis]WIH17688.1 dihydroxy-acid dehydratase [Xanthomonas translucens pv. graminis]